jgi:hypothetical protein
MCTRTNGELKALARHYMAKYTHDLVADMEGDLSGNFLRLMKEKAKASPRDGCRGPRPPLIGRSQAEDQPGDVKSDVDKIIAAMKVAARSLWALPVSHVPAGPRLRRHGAD